MCCTLDGTAGQPVAGPVPFETSAAGPVIDYASVKSVVAWYVQTTRSQHVFANSLWILLYRVLGLSALGVSSPHSQAQNSTKCLGVEGGTDLLQRFHAASRVSCRHLTCVHEDMFTTIKGFRASVVCFRASVICRKKHRHICIHIRTCKVQLPTSNLQAIRSTNGRFGSWGVI